MFSCELFKGRLINKILSVPSKPREYFSCIEIQSQIISVKFVMQLRQAKKLDMLRQSHQVIIPPIFINFQTLNISSTNKEESHLTGSSKPSPTTLLRHICSRNSVHCPHIPVKQPRTKQQTSVIVPSEFNPLALELDIYSLAHHLCNM